MILPTLLFAYLSLSIAESKGYSGKGSTELRPMSPEWNSFISTAGYGNMNGRRYYFPKYQPCVANETEFDESVCNATVARNNFDIIWSKDFVCYKNYTFVTVYTRLNYFYEYCCNEKVCSTKTSKKSLWGYIVPLIAAAICVGLIICIYWFCKKSRRPRMLTFGDNKVQSQQVQQSTPYHHHKQVIHYQQHASY